MKRILRLFIFLVLLIVVGVGVLAYYADSLAKTGIEKGMTDKLGVATTLDGVSLSFLSASCDLDRLQIANPPGFSSKPIFELGHGAVEVSAKTLNSDLVEIPRIEFDGIRLRLEQSGSKGNYDAILDRIGQGANEPKEEGGKRFVVRKVVIKDTRVNAVVDPLGGAMAMPEVEVVIPEIVLENIGSESSGGVTLAELGSQILGTVFVKVGDDVSGNLPQLIGQGLAKSLAGLPQLGEFTKDLQGGVGAGLQQLLGGGAGLEGVGGGLEKTVDDTMKKADDALKKGLGDILGGKR
ncbi:MAG: hypothetical protein H6807_00985 [Planctomycetes bacterium]|nr:hypothetical protein [Planctomycetota bacterium]